MAVSLGGLASEEPLAGWPRSAASRWTGAGARAKVRSTRRGNVMQDFAGRMAVVTGGGTGMGRELARQLIAEGCSVAMCDVSAKNMAETIALCEADGVPQGARITAHIADVSDEGQLIAFRDEARRE